MKKVLKAIWPYLNALAGFVLIGALGSALFEFCVEGQGARQYLDGYGSWCDWWSLEYRIISSLSFLPGVCYVTYVAARLDRRRDVVGVHFFVMLVSSLLAIAITLNNVNEMCGRQVHTWQGKVCLIAFLIVVSGVATFVFRMLKERRHLVCLLYIVVGFFVISQVPNIMSVWHKRAFLDCQERALDQLEQVFGYSVDYERYQYHKFALIQLGVLNQYEYMIPLDFTEEEGDEFLETVLAKCDFPGLIDASMSNGGHMRGLVICDIPEKKGYWDAFAREKGLFILNSEPDYLTMMAEEKYVRLPKALHSDSQYESKLGHRTTSITISRKNRFYMHGVPVAGVRLKKMLNRKRQKLGLFPIVLYADADLEAKDLLMTMGMIQSAGLWKLNLACNATKGEGCMPEIGWVDFSAPVQLGDKEQNGPVVLRVEKGKNRLLRVDVHPKGLKVNSEKMILKELDEYLAKFAVVNRKLTTIVIIPDEKSTLQQIVDVMDLAAKHNLGNVAIMKRLKARLYDLDELLKLPDPPS